MDDYCKRSGQIPAFGDWDYANELPITQYFESARQAGLIRYSSSSGESNDNYVKGDLYTVDHHPHKPYMNRPTSVKKTRVRERLSSNQQPHVKEHKKQQFSVNKVFDVTDPPRKVHHHKQQPQPLRHDAVPRPPRSTTRPPKPVDEDLYKIPPELLHNTKRKKMLGIFSRCLVPACSA